MRVFCEFQATAVDLRTYYKHRLKNMRYRLSVLAAILFTFVPFATQAAILKFGEEYTVPKNEVVAEDLYIGGGNVSVNGDVTGDLLVGSGNIVITGNIKDDLTVGGGSIKVLGNVGDDLRIAGGDITIAGAIGGDLVIAGGNVHILSTATIGGDILAGAGALIVDGAVTGDISAAGGALLLNSTVGGNVFARAEEIKLGTGAIVEGNFAYHAPKTASLATGTTIKGATDYTQVMRPAKHGGPAFAKGMFAFLSVLWLMKVLMLLLAALLLFALVPRMLTATTKSAIENFGSTTLRGFIILVVTPVAIILSFVTIIGMLVGIPAALIFGALIILSKILAGITFGSVIFRQFQKTKAVEVSWQSIAVGVVCLALLSVIPFVGWIACFLLFIASLGSLSSYLYQLFSGSR